MGHAERVAVYTELVAQRAVLGMTLLNTIRARIPAYRRLAPAQLVDVEAIGGWAMSRSIEMWAHGGSLNAGDLSRFRGIGTARALDGRPLPAVLRAYRIGAEVVSDVLVRQGGDRLGTEDILAMTRLWLTGIDEISEALTAGYAAGLDRLVGDRERAVRDLFNDLLVGRQTSAGVLADRSSQLRVELPANPCLLVVEPSHADVELTMACVVRLVDALAGDRAAEQDRNGPRRHLWTVHGRRAVLLLPSEWVAHVANTLAEHDLRGCLIERGLPVESAWAYRLAVETLEIAPAHAFEDGPLLVEGDALVMALLAGQGTGDPDEIIHSVLGSLSEPSQAHLLEGLNAFLATGSATAAAARLHLHPQSLRYRLHRIRAITGRDPRQSWHRLVFDIARHLLTIRAARGGPSANAGSGPGTASEPANLARVG